MTRSRFSLVALMGAVLIVAVGFGALRSASELWAHTAFSFALWFQIFAVLALLRAAKEMRRFWQGFALFGWAYLILAYGPWQVRSHLVTGDLLEYLYPRIARPAYAGTTNIVLWVTSDNKFWVDGQVVEAEELPKRIQEMSERSGTESLELYLEGGGDHGNTMSEVNAATQDAGIQVKSINIGSPPSRPHFERVGHSLFTLLIALVGGGLALWFFGERGEPTSFQSARYERSSGRPRGEDTCLHFQNSI